MLIHDSDPQGWTLKALREAGNSLMSELYGLDERTLRQRPADGEWSLKEIAAHMRDAEDLALKQMTAISSAFAGPCPPRTSTSSPTSATTARRTWTNC